MLNLMTAAGTNRASLEQISAVPIPEATSTWRPMPHVELVQEASLAITNAGMQISQQVHAITENGLRYFGMLQVSGELRPADYAPVIGLRNSHDKSFSAGLVCGSGVLVCDNLCFFGDIKVGRRHTRHISEDIPQLLSEAVGQLVDMEAAQAGRMQAYQSIQIQEDQTYPLLIKALDAGVIPSNKIGAVLQEWREPSFEEFAAERTVWRLFNAFTHVLKPRESGNDLFNLAPKTERLHGLLDAACGL